MLGSRSTSSSYVVIMNDARHKIDFQIVFNNEQVVQENQTRLLTLLQLFHSG